MTPTMRRAIQVMCASIATGCLASVLPASWLPARVALIGVVVALFAFTLRAMVSLGDAQGRAIDAERRLGDMGLATSAEVQEALAAAIDVPSKEVIAMARRITAVGGMLMMDAGEYERASMGRTTQLATMAIKQREEFEIVIRGLHAELAVAQVELRAALAGVEERDAEIARMRPGPSAVGPAGQLKAGFLHLEIEEHQS